MNRTAPALVALCAAACTTPTDQPQPDPALRSDAEVALRALMSESPRRGELLVTPDTLQLQIRRGAHRIPLLNVPRGTYAHGCQPQTPTPLPDGVDVTVRDAWWLFTDGPHAVALQLGARDIAAWFWDEARACPVRIRVTDLSALDDHPPADYYKADDAQITYRHRRSKSADLAETPEVSGDSEFDLLPEIPGVERLIAEADVIAIHAADGRALLQEEFRVDPGWPCYNAQLDVFREAAGGVYAIAAFDTWGDRRDCEATSGDTRYVNVVFDWSTTARAFVPRYRFVDQRRPLSPEGEDSLSVEEHWLGVAGGRLHTVRREAKRYTQGPRNVCVDLDLGTGTCLRTTGCWAWSSDDDRDVTFALITRAGTTIDLGHARTSARERGEDCGTP